MILHMWFNQAFIPCEGSASRWDSASHRGGRSPCLHHLQISMLSRVTPSSDAPSSDLSDTVRLKTSDPIPEEPAKGRRVREMQEPRFIERVLLVAGAQNTGKSVQIRSMFLDPRLGGEIPGAPNLLNVYQLSPFRRLYIRLTSPHELRETLDRFLEKIEENTDGYHRWNVASAVQIDAAENMPNLREVVTALDERFSPERIRVAILSPDRHGDVLAEIPALMQELQEVSSCETLCIDARSRRRNGLLLADTFDFA